MIEIIDDLHFSVLSYIKCKKLISLQRRVRAMKSHIQNSTNHFFWDNVITRSYIALTIHSLLSYIMGQAGRGGRWATDLRLLDCGRLTVTHRADVESLLSLQVSLSEELGHDSLGPLLVQRQRFRRVAQVSAVHQVLQNLSHVYIRMSCWFWNGRSWRTSNCKH